MDVRPEPDGVCVVVRRRRTRSAVGSGPRSSGPVRGRRRRRPQPEPEAIGIGTRTWRTPTHALSVLFHGPLWQVVGRHRYGIYVVEDPIRATLLPAGHGDRWVYSVPW